MTGLQRWAREYGEWVEVADGPWVKAADAEAAIAAAEQVGWNRACATVAPWRRDARMLAKRVNQCLDATRIGAKK